MTAVEWFSNKIDDLVPFISDSKSKIFLELTEKAKEMERQQIIDFHIEVMKKGLEYENEQEWDDKYLPLIKKRAEIYYNETYK